MSAKSYEVSCYSCRNSFDALRARWCECIVKERTLSCPSCGRCFCKAPVDQRRSFWADAPQEMWDRKLAEKATGFAWTNPSPADARRPLVLLVDDEVEIRAIARRVIEDAGYGLVMASNGPEALALAQSYRPDVVLSDVMMPKMDGRQLSLAIKSNPETAGVRVILMTSLYTDARYRTEATRDFKADDYVAKPLDVAQLLDVLTKHTS